MQYRSGMIKDEFRTVEELWPLLPVPDVNQEDLVTVLSGLAPGTYRARDLYNRYVHMVRGRGREPVTANRFGRELTKYGAHRDLTTADGVRHASWRITPPPSDTRTDG
jgi:hypothetical protein